MKREKRKIKANCKAKSSVEGKDKKGGSSGLGKESRKKEKGKR